jgi:hypothetical protein
MNDDTRERELRMDELDVVSGGGANVPSTQRARQIGHKAADGLRGIVDDSV